MCGNVSAAVLAAKASAQGSYVSVCGFAALPCSIVLSSLHTWRACHMTCAPEAGSLVCCCAVLVHASLSSIVRVCRCSACTRSCFLCDLATSFMQLGILAPGDCRILPWGVDWYYESCSCMSWCLCLQCLLPQPACIRDSPSSAHILAISSRTRSWHAAHSFVLLGGNAPRD